MNDEIPQEEEIMDTIGLDKKETEEFLNLTEEGISVDEALDVVGGDDSEPATDDPYDNEDPIV